MAAAIESFPSELMIKLLSYLGFKDLYRCKSINSSWYKLIGREFIVIEILLRLTVKSLLRIRFASKYCYKLISDVDFVKLHHTYQVRLNPSLVVVDNHFVFSVGLNPSSSSTSSHIHGYREDRYTHDLCHWFIDSCNGLLCFECFRPRSPYSYVLYNPATEACFNVPSYPTELGFTRWSTGFGYNCKDDDYKILILGYDDKDAAAFIYGFRDNSWRKTKRLPPPSNSRPWSGRHFVHHCTFVNNAFYWNFENDRIVSLKLVDERYSELPMPSELLSPLQPPPRRHERDSYTLSAPGRSHLHLLHHQTKLGRINLWIMKENGVRYSWTKLFTLRCTQFLDPLPLAYLNNKGRTRCQILLVSNVKRNESVHSLSYEFKTGKLDETRIFDGVPSHFEHGVAVAEWAESLFSIGMSNIIDGKEGVHLRS